MRKSTLFIRRASLVLMLLSTAVVSIHAAKAWIDVTAQHVQNPTFAANSRDGWTVTGQFSSNDVQYECMEVYNGTFDVFQKLENMPAGKYRLYVQGFYRTRENDRAYDSHQNNSENITAYLYAGDAKVKLYSVYAWQFDTNLANNCWEHRTGWWGWGTTEYYPNGMASGHEAFERGCYVNMLEFESDGGTIQLGIKNDTYMNQNWCLFDNFTLEYFGDVADPTTANITINELMPANVDMFWSPTTNFNGWVEVYNPSSEAVMLGGCYLSDTNSNLRLWQIPADAGVVPGGGYALIWFDDNFMSQLQAPFKLDIDGGTLYLSSPDGQLLASQTYPATFSRTSYARQSDGTGEWGVTGQPTPGATNSTSSFAANQLDAPEVTPLSQLFKSSVALHVDIPEGTTLVFTTDGTLPTLTNGTKVNATVYNTTVSNTTNYRFRLFRDGFLPSDVVTRSYLKNQNTYTVPVLSVVSSEDFLYSDQHGCMVRGKNGKPGRGQDQPCNWNMDWERPVNFVYMTADGQQLFQQDAFLSMCGGYSRAYEPHSFKLKGNKVFGTGKTLDYPFFDQKPYIRNRTLQIRNGGNDSYWPAGRIKDALLETMILRSNLDLDAQSYQPVIHYINGKFIGLINMREPNNKHYVFANYGWDDDEIDLFEMDADSGYVQKCGTRELFERLYNLSKRVNEPGVYDEIRQVLDVDEYINYMATTLYLGGNDWPQNNIKGYARQDGGRFRFISFDQDFAFEEKDPFTTFFNKKTYTFHYLYDKQTSLTLEIEMVTILQNLLKHSGFRKQFIDAFCIIGGSVFEKERATAIIDELATRVEGMMKFDNSTPWNTANDMKSKLNNWNSTVVGAMKRYSLFQLISANPQDVRLSCDTPGASLFINGLEIPYADFNGQLFAPAKLSVIPPAGYGFAGWKSNGQILSTDSEIELPAGTVKLVATFVALPSDEAPVVVNEVSAANDSYINEYYKRGDWIELYNTTNADVDVAGMYLSDDAENPHKYQIAAPSDGATTVIPAQGHLIVWCDKRDTQSQLHASFKLSDDGGLVLLTAADDSWSDVIYYPAHNMDQTVIRYPDGSRNVYVTHVPTIEKRNLRNSYMVSVNQDPNGILLPLTPQSTPLTLTYAVDRLVITSSAETQGDVRIYDAAGRQVTVVPTDIRQGRTEVLVPMLPRGYYVATVVDKNGQRATCKLVLR